MLATAGAAARYRRTSGLPRAVFGRASALGGVATALDAVAALAPRAAVAVLTIPPIGEALAAGLNPAVRDANRALRAAAAARPGVTVLDAHAAVAAALTVAGTAPPTTKGWRAPAPFAPSPPTAHRLWATYAALAARLVLRCRWDAVGAALGARVLFDGVHLGETGAACVLALTLPFCKRALRERAATWG
jgi:hypothetical protein